MIYNLIIINSLFTHYNIKILSYFLFLIIIYILIIYEYIFTSLKIILC